MLKAYLQHGSADNYPMQTNQVEIKEKFLWWQKGLSCTSTNYSKYKEPTTFMVKFNNRWRRVYCRKYSRDGNLYILDKNTSIRVDIEGISS